MSPGFVLQKIRERRLIAIVRGVSPDDVGPVAEALLAGGIDCLELALDHSREDGVDRTLASIRALDRAFGSRLLLGAGTVLSADEAVSAADAGARYIISPNTDEAVIAATKALGLVSMPGALTPSEAVRAHACGADIVKLFPAGQFGPAYLRALRSPLPHLLFSAVGGVDEKNAADFLRAGACCLGLGGKLVSLPAIASKNFDALTQSARLCREAVDAFEREESAE
ncbi:bifunctional 4-hydroxy-2-oxoglutarate aldolase/2-dehydro-3-deoxy-phosphogluconate aldolase [Feifania hominis]|uniref:Bifunctional 4-hydroxy-2-oxoglutarate aldolase/2-dehydro-3-deoxy-phosphogluconate aldolase n=1 Tax=Feifania hominis TaxID=2763660 RepID=A0A926DDT3_9FIRM|nr:bifunctional 4-hydroxy-2-oxoglutarate aldolase/2-dehydro-3-deoxy-phosphogluconate aldolase [Feifania hominis]MBC8536356.1 bifunctional 4-hydroxy-2-oxoglutarate aldolase/2-dehydro-3-deoxy-phosphogluconate aldolase [Feifania hominis]